MTIDMKHRPAPQNDDTAFFGHPKALRTLCVTEAWERFSFSGMQTLLVLYMVDELLRPGHSTTVLGFGVLRWVTTLLDGPLAGQALASVVFGLYSSLVFLAPIFGGAIGDRLFGRTPVVIAGAVLMALGNLLLVFETSFVVGLVVLVLGTGCIKGNISVQVAALYQEGDRRRSDAFQIFTAGIDAGVVAAPLICGTIGTLFGWRFGFLAASIGMLVGLCVYLAGKSGLPPDRSRNEPRPLHAQKTSERRSPLGLNTLAALIGVFVLVTVFLSSAGQLGNVYSLWIRDHVDRHIGGFDIPIPWFQSLTPLFSIAFTPAVVRLWRMLAKRGREPKLVEKIAAGLCIEAIALMILSVLSSSEHGSIGWLWLLPVHVLVCVAFLLVWPAGLAFFAEKAPEGFVALLIGAFFLSSFVAGNIVGRIGTFYVPFGPASFWALQAQIAAAGAGLAVVATLLARIRWRQRLHTHAHSVRKQDP